MRVDAQHGKVGECVVSDDHSWLRCAARKLHVDRLRQVGYNMMICDEMFGVIEPSRSA